MKKLILLLFTLISSNVIFAQSDTTITACGVQFIGPGTFGVTAYSPNVDTSMTIISDNTTNILVYFTDKDLGAGDTIFVYAGPDFNSPLIDMFVDTGSAHDIYPNSPVITVRMTSDGTSEGTGFMFDMGCYPQAILSVDNGVIYPGANYTPTVYTANIGGYEIARLALIIGTDTLWDENPTVNTNQLTGNFNVSCTLEDNAIKRIEIYDMQYFVAADSTSLSIMPQLIIDSIVVVNPNCNGSWDGSAEAFVSGGSAPYTYQWFGQAFKIGDNNQVNMSPNLNSNISAGTYNLNVMDNNGCNLMRQYTLTDPPALLIFAGNDTTICQSSSANLQASASGGSGNYLYEWFTDPTLFDNGNGSATVNPNETMSYTSKVTDDKFCTAQASVNVYVNPLPTADAGLDSTFCSPSTFYLNAYDEAVGNTISWTSSGALPVNPNAYLTSADVDSTTEFIATITDINTGCINSDAVVVFFGTPKFNTQGTMQYCYPETVNLVALNEDPTINFSWSPSTDLSMTEGMSILATPSGNITYTVVGTSQFGCTDTQTVSLVRAERPVANFIMPSTACKYESVSYTDISISNAGYIASTMWNFGDNGGASMPNPTHAYSLADTFTVLLHVSNDLNCSDDTTFNIIINDIADPSFSGLVSEYCVNDTNQYILTPAVSGGIFTGNGMTDSIFTPADAGIAGFHTIGYQITNVFGCTTNTSFTVQLNSPPTTNVLGISNFCDNQNGVELMPLNPGGSYTGTAAVAMVGDSLYPSQLSAGTYTLSYSFTNGGCSNTSDYTFIIIPAPAASILTVTPLRCDSSNGELVVYVSSAASTVTYSWLPGGFTGTNNTFPVFGVNTVIVTDTAGCSTSVDTTIANYPTPRVDSIHVVNPNCNLYDGSLTVFPGNGTAPYEFVWNSSPENSPTIDSIRADNYSLHLVDANGCFKDTSFNISYQGYYPNLTGNISIAGNPLSLGGELVLYQVTDSGAYNKITTYTINSNGDFSAPGLFARKYLLMVKPDSIQYPNGVKTYYGNTHRWEFSPAFDLGCSIDSFITINVIDLTPPPGNGTVTGQILDVTVRDSSDTIFGGRIRKPGEPIRGIDIILEDVPGGNISMRTTTDTSGIFVFENVPPDNYKIYVNVPGCGMLATYDLSVGSSGEYYFQKDFYVDSVAGTIDTVTYVPLAINVVNSKIKNTDISGYPNPFNSNVNVNLSVKENTEKYLIQLTDISGSVILLNKGTLIKGENKISLDFKNQNLASGFYFLNITKGNETPISVKIIKE